MITLHSCSTNSTSKSEEDNCITRGNYELCTSNSSRLPIYVEVIQTKSKEVYKRIELKHGGKAIWKNDSIIIITSFSGYDNSQNDYEYNIHTGNKNLNNKIIQKK